MERKYQGQHSHPSRFFFPCCCKRKLVIRQCGDPKCKNEYNLQKDWKGLMWSWDNAPVAGSSSSSATFFISADAEICFHRAEYLYIAATV
ncbi:hypothetical protein BST61_g11446 [Cercospora zeina]